jgi:hypothetical protein
MVKVKGALALTTTMNKWPREIERICEVGNKSAAILLCYIIPMYKKRSASAGE